MDLLGFLQLLLDLFVGLTLCLLGAVLVLGLTVSKTARGGGGRAWGALVKVCPQTHGDLF